MYGFSEEEDWRDNPVSGAPLAARGRTRGRAVPTPRTPLWLGLGVTGCLLFSAGWLAVALIGMMR